MKKNYFKNLMQVSLLLGAAFVISSCDDVIGQEDNPVASYVQWKAKTPEEVTLKIGNTYTVQATAVSSAIIVYESEKPEIAKVDPVTGEITAVAVGETNINAVITGASSAGKSVFTPEKISIKVIVKDGNAKLTRVKDEEVEYTANVGSVIDLTKLFTAYPEVGDGAQKSTVEYTILGKNDKKEPYDQNLATISDGTKVKILANGTIRDWYKDNDKKGTDISDTLYVRAELTPNDTKEYKVAKSTDVEDTIMVIINKSIAYMNAEGKRDILTADKYKELDLTKEFAVEAGTYYVTKAPTTTPTEVTDIKGNVTLIFKNTVDEAKLQNLDDKKDGSTLNIFGEAIAKTKKSSTTEKPEYEAWSPTITLTSEPYAITNFKEINIYTGTVVVNGGTKVKDINVYGGTLKNENAYSNAFELTGTLTVNGGNVVAKGKGSGAYAIKGNVAVLKGTLTATNKDYRAISGTLTKGDKVKLYNDKEEITENDNSTVITTEAPKKDDK